MYVHIHISEMMVNFTIRIPRELHEKMRRYRDVNWSEIIRRSIEDYLRKLEEMERVESSDKILMRLMELGISPEDLEPLPIDVEKKLLAEVKKLEWKRLGSTTQAQ